jgi:uncharacterized protein (TIRG00374 family)
MDKEQSPLNSNQATPQVTDAPAAAKKPPASAKALVFTLLRWCVAIGGIAWVISNMSLHDRAVMLDAHNHPVVVTLANPPGEGFRTVDVVSPQQFVGSHDRAELLNKPDLKTVQTLDGVQTKLLAVKLSDDLKTAHELLIADTQSGDGRWIAPDAIKGGYIIHTPYPLIDAGLSGMLAKADALYLIGAVLIFPLTYLITSYRFDLLLRALDIHMRLVRAFVLNMVGAFYNTFMPGSTGGDLLKAYYASKLTPHRTRAVMCVIVDRVLGLLALIIIGGVAAASQWNVSACRKVALGSGAIIGATAAGLIVFFVPVLRRLTGLDFILVRLPMQKTVHAAVETLEIYRRRPWIIAWSLIVSLPVHATVICSAMLAGLAFGILRDHWEYYWVAVPVIVLAGSIPISPQGVGVMEGFAILLLRPQGGTIAQAFTLTMCVRLVQMLWNLSGGLFVLHGGFHAPTEQEQRSMETDLPDTAGEAAAPTLAPTA